MTRKPNPTHAARKGKAANIGMRVVGKAVAARELDRFATRTALREHDEAISEFRAAFAGLMARLDHIDGGPRLRLVCDSEVTSQSPMRDRVDMLEQHLDAHRERLSALEARPWWRRWFR